MEEIGALLRELIVAGHDTTDGRLGEIWVYLIRKGLGVVDGELGPEGQ